MGKQNGKSLTLKQNKFTNVLIGKEKITQTILFELRAITNQRRIKAFSVAFVKNSLRDIVGTRYEILPSRMEKQEW